MTYLIVTRNYPRCVYCEAAKNLANKAKLEFKEVPADSVFGFLMENNLRSIPVVFKESLNMENYIGGFDAFQKHVYNL